ncbi:MAG: glycosyltransferase [Rhodospirillales bacterium]|nr:MAG: glycosyltransferase [Rhodospirillales bacterium]
MRAVIWGTYDLGKPRNRILLRGLREAGVDVVEIHRQVWAGIEDKGAVTGLVARLKLLARWLGSYPSLVIRYLLAPPHDAVLVGYLGHLDVLVLYPFARLRGVPIVWDAFLSLYNTVVEDRRMIRSGNPIAWCLFAWEWLSCRAAHVVVLDTRAHADHFSKRYRLRRGKTASILLGVELDAFAPASEPSRGEGATVLFYGQFTPLHGVETIVRAAQHAYGEPIRWILIGEGQEAERARRILAEAPANVEWITWVDYEQLRLHIAAADVCLGVFGDTDKAARVIPNKVYQVLAAGAPLVTRDCPAIRELLSPDMPGVYLIPPADPEALAREVGRAVAEAATLSRPLHRDLLVRIAPDAVGSALVSLLQSTCAVKRPRPA